MAKASGSIDLKATSDAAKRATNYVTEISSDGVFVHTSGDSSTSTGSGVHIGASAINIIKSGVSYIKAWISNMDIPYVRIGREDKGNVLIDNDSVDIRDGTTVSASFGANLISLGNPSNSPHVEVTPNTMTFYDSNGGDSAFIEFYDDDNWEKRFVIRSEQTNDDYAGVAVVASDYIGSDMESEVQVYASRAISNPEMEVFSAMRVSGTGVTVDFNGSYNESKPFKVRDIYDPTNIRDVFEVGASGYSIRACDGVISGISASSFKTPTTGTITSVTMYRHNGIIYMNLGFKNTTSRNSGAAVLDTYLDYENQTALRSLKPVVSSYGIGYFGSAPLTAFFGSSDGHLVVRNTSSSAVTVWNSTSQSGATVTISWVAPLEGFSS